MKSTAKGAQIRGPEALAAPAATRARALGWDSNSAEEDHSSDDIARISEVDRLREENRRLAISLGGFSAFIASRGLLEEAWNFIHNIHQEDDGESRE
ncbi:MAG TPA: hypothetical protein VFI91_09100 [Longimicrobiaceae bacterium]|nr:hypothetical protein [Longimicrobiaceae bacterium]